MPTSWPSQLQSIDSSSSVSCPTSQIVGFALYQPGCLSVPGATGTDWQYQTNHTKTGNRTCSIGTEAGSIVSSLNGMAMANWAASEVGRHLNSSIGFAEREEQQDMASISADRSSDPSGICPGGICPTAPENTLREFSPRSSDVAANDKVGGFIN